MRCVKVTCPHCGSDVIRREELIPLTTDISRFYRDETGTLTFEQDEEDEGRAFWDCGEAADPPYSCGQCFKPLKDEELVIGEEYEEEDDDLEKEE